MRIALLSWLVSLATLAIFVLVTLPQQSRSFLENLESKANGLAVSLHDVAAGAAVNEDYASVVSASQTLLAGDPDLDFIIMMKHDGFALVIEQERWQVAEYDSPFWLKRKRVTSSTIEIIPDLKRRVFHFAQPFDYSGIEWGWIHIGLSLQGYDLAVATLYRNTVVIGVVCILFSFLISVLYARHIVRPIIRLKKLVRQIAGGDLSVRAGLGRHDELGQLADSVDIMASALSRRDQILDSVRFAAQQFLQSTRWEEAINEVMEKIGNSAGVSRVLIYSKSTDVHGKLTIIKLTEWLAPEIAPREVPIVTAENYDKVSFFWYNMLGMNEIIVTKTEEISGQRRDFMLKQGTLASIAVPIFVDGTLWGVLVVDDCWKARDWTDAEEDSLRTAADMLGATIGREKAQLALLDAKATLEQRVEERTRELQDQVEAKQTALAELAAAQNSMVSMSRAAGMAEVATGVLHNVGNVLNSVNVSSSLLVDHLRSSRIGNVAKVAGLLDDPPGGIASFMSEDPRGLQLPAYLRTLATALEEERQVMLQESESLGRRIEHIKEIVSMQQSFGLVSGITESIDMALLMEDAIKLNSASLDRHNIKLIRDYATVAPIIVDKHKVLQIVLNLLNNAKNACSDHEGGNKHIIIHIHDQGFSKLIVAVEDNGIGIHPDNLTRIFQHGFTTRRKGHGFGLHSAALAAREMGGQLSVHSDGVGRGALFTLELPRNLPSHTKMAEQDDEEAP